MPLLSQLGDISLGNGEKLQGLSYALGNVRANGKLVGEDLNMMIERGFNPLEVMSKKTGKSMAELRKEMEKGNITYDMVKDAMATVTSEGGRFYKGMENASKTFS